MSATARPTIPPGVRLLIDFGPLVVFFVSYQLGHAGLLTHLGTVAVPAKHAMIFATEATMLASFVALIVSVSLTRKVSAALIVTSVLVLLFGGLTIALDNPEFIKIKPTIAYVLYACVLLAGLVMKRPLLKMIFDQGFPPMAHAGWVAISRNFALFFLVMAALNEFFRRSFSENTWLNYDTWGVVAITGLFMASQYPVISKHIEDEPKSVADAEASALTPPPPG